MKIRVNIDDQTFDVEVGDLNARPVPVVVDGETFQVWPADQAPAQGTAEPVASVTVPKKASTNGKHVTPAAQSGDGGSNAVTAPIPGVIISIAVKVGDTVSVGQELLILEAMKMKNNIRASRAGKIAAVRVAPGDQVKRGQVMLEFEV